MKKRVHISFSVQADGLIRTECISTTEDLWHDFLYFKVKSNNLTSPSDTMLRLRYLRAAVSAFYAYVEGVVNEWCAELNADPGVGQSMLQEFVRRRKLDKRADTIEGFIRYTCLEVKCEFITECVNKRGHSLSNFKGFDYKMTVRNAYAHPKPRSDYTLFKALFVVELDNLESAAADWLDTAAQVLGFSRHPDTRKIIDDLGKHMGDSSSSFESGSDDFCSESVQKSAERPDP